LIEKPPAGAGCVADLIGVADELSWLINKYTQLQQVQVMLNLTILMLTAR